MCGTDPGPQDVGLRICVFCGSWEVPFLMAGGAEPGFVLSWLLWSLTAPQGHRVSQLLLTNPSGLSVPCSPSLVEIAIRLALQLQSLRKKILL